MGCLSVNCGSEVTIAWFLVLASLGLIGQNVCLDRTHVPLMLIQPEREGVLAVEFFPDSPVTPFRPPIALLRG